MNSIKALLALALLPVVASCQPAPEPVEVAADERRFADERRQLAASIRDYAEPIREPANPRIISAVGELPRHLFVPTSQQPFAYRDEPLPIGEDQTISQPSLVALMTHLLRPSETDVMLEVGTGSGYQAALLSKLVRHVYTIEIVEPLARQAAQRLADLGYANVTVRHGDGYAGWPQYAPFDGIIVTAGAPHVPKPLLDQLKPGGRMVIPVGPADSIQQLKLIAKDSRGRVREEIIIPVRFVPLTRQ
ncbi:protein-L-isoaspartate(D-aspartate) O-methyltransferase [Sphingomonas sp.]|uniref:protein-L-isoaspartate(D-aspartate) O-methyltransferase n=1 Tax=Sphingomonas sp. TaxID=28214 RepID=UPI00184697EA|nr:protein-L-isoaspartate(D-aspartate) O-methyltransferase [Sphingomonas sp.]MBA3512471.1 protein-L-isoaspartate(D-aspartate) O-methyltransferase [Sphingomonas sp.]